MLKKVLILLVLIAIPATLFAGTVKFGENYSLLKEEEVRDDLYVAGSNIAVSGDIFGDIFAGGLNVFSGGNSVSEDLFIIGGTVNVLSNVEGDVRLVGAKVFFGGTAGEDLVSASQEIQLLPQSVVNGNLLVAGSRVVVNGEIRGDASIIGGEVFINDLIEGDVWLSANRVVLGPETIINGNLSYSSGNRAQISPSAQILGETTYKPISARPSAENFLPTLWGTWVLVRFIVLLVSALIFHAIFRNISTKFVSTSIEGFWRSLLRGFLFVIAVPAALVLILLTFIGIPFSILGVALYVGFLFLASVYGPVVLGSLVYKLIKKEKSVVVDWKTILLGVVLVLIISFIPYVSEVVRYGFILVALGGISKVIFDKFIEAR